ncbi:MAG: hypothetical protein JNK04_19900 [Myxococcales bacterium]|nr:hypothetical protein [Myxococcales bacterium]
MRALTLAAGLTIIAGCGGRPPVRVAPPAIVEKVAAIAALPPPPPSLPLAQAPSVDLGQTEDLRVPTDFVCLLRAPTLDAARLRLKPDGVDFAMVANVTEARVRVTGDPVGTGLFVEVEKGGLSLIGVSAATDMPMYTKAPIKLGGIFLPDGDTELRIGGASKAALVLEAARTPYALRELTATLRADVACSAVSLQPTKIDARASLGKAIGFRYFVGGEVPLSLTAGGEPVAILQPGPPWVEVLERSGGAARVAWRLNEGHVSGWVDTMVLTSTPQKYEVSTGRLGGMRMRPPASGDPRACDHDVALGVDLNGEARFVGRLHAGTTIPVLGALHGPEHTEVMFDRDELTPLGGARFFVRTGDIADCARAKRPRLQPAPRCPC